jgi:hypothetical protein
VALSASKFVCAAMDAMTFITAPIASVDSPSYEIVSLVASALAHRAFGDGRGL